MWTEIAYAVALTDYWMKIRRMGPDASRHAFITILQIWERAAIFDYIDRLHKERQAPVVER